MSSTQFRRRFLKSAAALAVSAPSLIRAIPSEEAPWLAKQIRMVIPFAAGGTTDLLARAVGQHMAEVWKQPVVADNRPGANGVVAGEIVAKSAGDRSTPAEHCSFLAGRRLQFNEALPRTAEGRYATAIHFNGPLRECLSSISSDWSPCRCTWNNGFWLNDSRDRLSMKGKRAG
jgi:hypothetical protein